MTYSVKTPAEPQGEDRLPGVREDPDLGQVTQRDDDSCCEAAGMNILKSHTVKKKLAVLCF